MSGKEAVVTTDANPWGPRTTRPRAKPREGELEGPSYARNLAGCAQNLPEAALRAAATLDRVKLRSSWCIRVVVAVLASRGTDSVYRNDINISTAFGTVDKCNPLKAAIETALR